MPKRILKGIVVSDKGDKSITVKVDRRVRHPLYQKIITRSKKYHAHDENNQFKIGDEVSIIETRPISKTKRWAVITDGTEAKPSDKKVAPKTEKKPAAAPATANKAPKKD